MEHLDIISRIVETEKNARRKVGLAEEERRNLEDELVRRREEMRTKYMRRAEERIADVREKEAAFAKAKIKELELALHSDLERDTAYAAENRAKWVEDVFFSVLAISTGETS